MTSTSAQPLVLFVDDHDDTRTMYSEFFAGNGFRTADAADGLAALAVAKALCPDAIVLDIHMPRLDGIGTLGQLRALAKFRDVPVLVLTSFDVYEVDARAAGATAICVKPCTPDQLLNEIRMLLSRMRR